MRYRVSTVLLNGSFGSYARCELGDMRLWSTAAVKRLKLRWVRASVRDFVFYLCLRHSLLSHILPESFFAERIAHVLYISCGSVERNEEEFFGV